MSDDGSPATPAVQATLDIPATSITAFQPGTPYRPAQPAQEGHQGKIYSNWGENRDVDIWTFYETMK